MAVLLEARFILEPSENTGKLVAMFMSGEADAKRQLRDDDTLTSGDSYLTAHAISKELWAKVIANFISEWGNRLKDLTTWNATYLADINDKMNQLCQTWADSGLGLIAFSRTSSDTYCNFVQSGGKDYVSLKISNV